MKIAILGAGKVGSALACALTLGGHDIIFGVRRPAGANQATIAIAVQQAELSILAVPYHAISETIAAAGGFAGRVLIDATNPFGMVNGELGLTVGFETSGAEQTAALAPGAKLFKTFNQTGFENLGDAQSYQVRPIMFVAGNDATSMPLVLQLIDDAGFEAIDVGPLRAARLLEPFGMLWTELARKREFGPNIAMALLRKERKSQ